VFVHYSTDFVFDGEIDRAYTEEDIPDPQSAYGMSKLLSEWFALEDVGRAGSEVRRYVLRVESLFGGAASRSTIDSMLQNFAAGRPVRAFTDRTVSPSHVGDIARATRELVERQAHGGVYHCVNSGMATWREIAEHLRDGAGYSEGIIEPIRTTDVVLKAKRPRFCALSNEKLLRAGIPMPTWQDALQAHLRR
jgi:dTDP-4-dehydrorhamnose reductase